MKTSRKRILALVVCILLATSILAIFAWLPAGKEPLPPSPNGYESVLKAASLLGPYLDETQPTEGRIAVYLSDNKQALDKARIALKQQSRVVLGYSQKDLEDRLAQLSLLKRLAKAFVLEGRLAELQKRFGAAATSYLDTIKLGRTAGHGGVMIDGLVGISCERLGTQRLQGLLGQLSAKECRQVLTELRDRGHQSDTAIEVLRQEKRWARRTFPLPTRLWAGVMRLMPNAPLRAVEANFMRRYRKHRQDMKQFRVQVTERTSELEKESPSKKLDARVPAGLK